MNAAPIISPVFRWRSPPDIFVLNCDEVHVWRATLDQAPPQIEGFLYTLAPDEQARAARFHFARDRQHFIVARGTLRAILGRYLNRRSECLSFCYSSYGKPALVEGSALGAIRFNVSHSHGIALYAVTRGREVGIDLEHIRLDLAVAQIAERFFSRREVAVLQALPAEFQREAFFRYWTHKEAYIKARGEGLSLPLDQFDVSLEPGKSSIVVSAPHDPSETLRWSLQELTPAPGYAAALAVEGHGHTITLQQFMNASQPSL